MATTKHSSTASLTALAVLAIVLVSLVPTQVSADASWVNANDIISAILETVSFTPQQLEDLDLNNDTVIDATDLVCFTNGCHREANFQLVTSDIEEGEGSLEITVDFGLPVNCDLQLVVIEGTATPTADYAPPTTTIPVSGDTASLFLTVIDDAVMSEEIEMLTLELRPGACYVVGGVNQHTVKITDNDAVWFGTLRDGATTLGITMEIAQFEGGQTSTLTADGYGTLPAGSWPATSFSFVPESAFSAQVGPVDMDSATTSFEETISRTYTFTATGEDVQKDSITGTYEEAISSSDPNGAHLGTIVAGEFTLIKEVARPSSWNPPPTDLTKRRR